MRAFKKVLIVGGALVAIGAVAGAVLYRKHGKKIDRVHKIVKDEMFTHSEPACPQPEDNVEAGL